MCAFEELPSQTDLGYEFFLLSVLAYGMSRDGGNRNAAACATAARKPRLGSHAPRTHTNGAGAGKQGASLAGTTGRTLSARGRKLAANARPLTLAGELGLGGNDGGAGLGLARGLAGFAGALGTCGAPLLGGFRRSWSRKFGRSNATRAPSAGHQRPRYSSSHLSTSLHTIQRSPRPWGFGLRKL